MGILAFGEGWHNNHHAYQRVARQGRRWREIDVTYWAIWLMEKVGLAWDVIRVGDIPKGITRGKAGRRRNLGDFDGGRFPVIRLQYGKHSPCKSPFLTMPSPLRKPKPRRLGLATPTIASPISFAFSPPLRRYGFARAETLEDLRQLRQDLPKLSTREMVDLVHEARADLKCL